MPEWTKEKWCSRLSEDEILDELQTKTDCTKYSNHFWKRICMEKHKFISTNCAEKERQLFMESLQGGKFVKNLEFILIE